MMRSAVLIESKKGSLRANHYHLTDWHYCYILHGQMEYFHRRHGDNNEPAMLIVEAGQMVFTPPMVDHAMRFPKDTIFLTLSRNPRDQASYEADVRRIDLISTQGLKTWMPGD
jgi:oxalate decarboxylase/phosphoglucose isomerase-like protein (cupin superfamily)